MVVAAALVLVAAALLDGTGWIPPAAARGLAALALAAMGGWMVVWPAASAQTVAAFGERGARRLSRAAGAVALGAAVLFVFA